MVPQPNSPSFELLGQKEHRQRKGSGTGEGTGWWTYVCGGGCEKGQPWCFEPLVLVQVVNVDIAVGLHPVFIGFVTADKRQRR